MLEAVHIPILLLLQINLPHHLTDFVLDWAVFGWYGGCGTIEKLVGPTQQWHVTVL
jgi:hypothetical protein